jgi:hypothetical protein
MFCVSRFIAMLGVIMTKVIMLNVVAQLQGSTNIGKYVSDQNVYE